MKKAFAQIWCLFLIVAMAAVGVIPAAASHLLSMSKAPAATPIAESCHEALIPSGNSSHTSSRNSSRTSDSKPPSAPVSPARYICCLVWHDAAIVRNVHVEIPLAELAGAVTEQKPLAAPDTKIPHDVRLDSPPSSDPHPLRI
jgi:hypothetical protein